MTSVIVAGHVNVAPDHRPDYLATCMPVLRRARSAPGCLDFAISADPLDPGRINVYERWASRAAVEAFRGDGPSGEQATAIISVSILEFDVTDERTLM